MGSFRLRLVVYFVLLSLVPLAGATWAFSETAGRSELRRADASLGKSVSAAVGSVATTLDQAGIRAEELARSRDVQMALASADLSTLEELARRMPDVAFAVDDVLLAGQVPDVGARRSANVVDGSTVIGRVTVSLPYDDRLLADMAERAALGPDEALMLVVDGRVVAGPVAVGELVSPTLGRAADMGLGGTDFRAVGAGLPQDGTVAAEVVALVPRSTVDGAVTDLNLALILAALGSMAIVAAVAFLPARAIVASLRELGLAAAGIAQGNLSERVPVHGRDEFAGLAVAFNDMAEQLESRQDELAAERLRVRLATERLGAALAAGNAPERLLLVIAASAHEATGAAAAAVLRGEEVAATAGDPTHGGDPIDLDLGRTERGEPLRLLLYPASGARFDETTLGEARALATQMTIALDNAALHQLMASQAVTDELTQLANRRRFEEALAHEVSRVERFGGPLSLIVVDLDDFKNVNDGFGHQAGDAALRAFADMLRAGLRVVDLPARPGGEEFAVILPGTPLADACLVAERLRRTFAATSIPSPDGAPLVLSASFGVAEHVDGSAPEALFAAADEALYRAKAEGKNRVVGAERAAAGAA